ncbi:hypothetical protein P154DRAFT_584572 [Amniculicola lignicola CBS 123094]|uniref:Phosphatidylinositol N-acetylglucosaminyltransferase subunit H conserved domain-containing protein n=1 Tax=Amniculicola lignicola CBS 123094 TaxID=1392246 RepID=A0A6A5X541_9PLEO|nr:hypothetical protein P154DRAFT_584572 [Amniculicola lignicola CBS 123094]
MLALIQSFTSPPSQRLSVVQPASSTISFVVSTRTVSKTVPAVVSHYISILVRILVGALTLVGLWTKWCVSSGKATTQLSWSLGRAMEPWVVRVAEGVQWRYLAPGALLVLWLVVKRRYTEETLLAIRGLGLQTSTSSPTYLTTASTRFIPTTSIQDIFIHEAFKGFEVRFYLAIVVKGEQDVVVVFPTLLPRRAILEDVWRGARACLYEGGMGKDVEYSEDTPQE